MARSFWNALALAAVVAGPVNAGTPPPAAAGGPDVTISAQVRQRFEVDDRDFDSATGAGTYNLLRSRLGVTLAGERGVRVFLQVQDSRVFGEETSTLGDGHAEQLDLHQGYVVVDDLFGRPVSLKIGRMEFNLGPQRLIGAVGWDNVGRSFDGAMLGVKVHDRATLRLFSFTEVDAMAAGDVGDRYVHGAYADLDVSENYTTQAFWIWQRWSPQEDRDRHTLGFYARRTGRFHHETEFAYQVGRINAIPGSTVPPASPQDVQAFLAAVTVGVAFPDAALSPDVSAGVDYLSGDDDPADGDFKVFDTMYATNHKYYGYMDYFLNIPRHTGGLGLVDTHGRLAVKAADRTRARVDYHYFSAAQDYTLDDGSTSKAFGHEVDVTVTHAYGGGVTFTAGASLFAPGAVFEEIRGADTSTWFYLMTTVGL